MSVCQMALSLFAANEGYLDDVAVEKIVDFENAMQSYMAANQAELLDKVNSTGDWNDEIESAFHDALKAFKASSTW
jgi:F-type H+-transporting ATPase subunit alpha